MVQKQLNIENLKSILENLHDPEMLDQHPWVSFLFVQEFLQKKTDFHDRTPGFHLAAAIGQLFESMKPGLPPRRGKRLDSRWGEFGLLAAHYFVPGRNGRPRPVSLRDAWSRIDEAILQYSFDEPSQLSSEVIEQYRLVGNESQAAPISTLSDWHRKGLERLMDTIRLREDYLKNNSFKDGLPIGTGGNSVHAPTPPVQNCRKAGRFLFPMLFLLLVLIAVWGYWKVERIYSRALILKQDISDLQNLMASPSLESISDSGSLLSSTHRDLDLLREEVRFVLWLGPYLKWVPVYGGDLAASETLFDMAHQLLVCAENAHSALFPILVARSEEKNLDLTELILQLEKAQPDLMRAQQAFILAKSLREDLDVDELSTLTRTQMVEDLDPIMLALEDGLSLLLSIPGLLGGSNEGPKTYLLLVQNEDELRPTGGFITAVGKIVLVGGKIADLDFSDSGSLDNWERPYPLAPWQLNRYMNSRVLVLRDANWFTDFPTTALYAESLYAYRQSHSVDGVIAFDQQMLVLLLQELGPLDVQGTSVLIDSENVISFMRASKSLPDGQPVPDGWSRKGFIEDIARAVTESIYSDEIPLEILARTLLQGLEERHVLLYMDDVAVSKILARRGWDGALKAGTEDFLMLVDANIGFNKTNALVDTNIIYDVDLTNPDHLTSTLVVRHTNRSSSEVDCRHWGSERVEGEKDYPINACYWNYMRVYLPVGTMLLDSSSQTIPNEWMILGRGQEGQVDILDQETWEGLTAFGTLMVVPGGESLSTGFSFVLPKSVLQEMGEGDQQSYQLTIRKQPGTIAIPITIRIHLPNSARLLSAPSGTVVSGSNLLIKADLRIDRKIMVVFGK